MRTKYNLNTTLLVWHQSLDYISLVYVGRGRWVEGWWEEGEGGIMIKVLHINIFTIRVWD